MTDETDTSLEARAKRIIIDHLCCSDRKLTNETKFDDDLGADSLDMVELLMGFEEEFEFNAEDHVVEKIKTVGDAIEYLKGVVK